MLPTLHPREHVLDHYKEEYRYSRALFKDSGYFIVHLPVNYCVQCSPVNEWLCTVYLPIIEFVLCTLKIEISTLGMRYEC